MYNSFSTENIQLYNAAAALSQKLNNSMLIDIELFYENQPQKFNKRFSNFSVSYSPDRSGIDFASILNRLSNEFLYQSISLFYFDYRSNEYTCCYDEQSFYMVQSLPFSAMVPLSNNKGSILLKVCQQFPAEQQQNANNSFAEFQKHTKSESDIFNGNSEDSTIEAGENFPGNSSSYSQ
mmetsp:Transcript_7804/g.7051  ORF Transcript_7804/g.7051 Transcript_7804/m.7051 type:complete len:179 (-) Transcript_7804:617-1153(-)